MPVFGPLMIKAALARYLQTLSLLLDNAVAMPEALSLAADACTIASYRQRLSVMREAVIMMPKLMATAIIAPRSDEVWSGRVALPTARTCRRIAKTEPAHNSVLPSSTRSRLACSRSNLPKSVMMLTRTLPVQPKVNRPDIPMIGPSRRHRSGRVTLPSPRVV